MSDPAQPRLNGTQLGKALGRSRMYVICMKAAGYQFEFGSLTTQAHAEDWLRAHPKFKTTPYFHPDRKPARKARRACVIAD